MTRHNEFVHVIYFVDLMGIRVLLNTMYRYHNSSILSVCDYHYTQFIHRDTFSRTPKNSRNQDLVPMCPYSRLLSSNLHQKPNAVCGKTMLCLELLRLPSGNKFDVSHLPDQHLVILI